MCLSRPSRRITQQTLGQWMLGPAECTYANIEPVGDPLVRRQEKDGIIRFGYQNTNGSDMGKGFEIATEIDAIGDLGLDVGGLSELHKPWDSKNKWQYDAMMEIRFGHTETVYSSAPTSHDCKYQAGGNLLTTNGATTGRIDGRGTDKLGRFCWFTLQGARDEGILVVVAYRVCQDTSDKPGANTAFMQQYTAMREKGEREPNPRKQILRDIEKLITQKRQEGYRPILMMDANGDYSHERDPDKDLAKFIEDANLVDHFRSRFPQTTRTYLYGSKRLDYILMDPVLTGSVKSIGYLGIHDAALSDHVMAYVDFDASKLFRGEINRPVPIHAREFRLEHKNIIKLFLEELIPALQSHKIRSRVRRLVADFAEYGKTDKNVQKYQRLDQEITELVKGIAAKVGRKKYGYMRSPELALSGRILVLFKMILDCRQRNAPFSDALIRRAETLGVDIHQYSTTPTNDIRKEVCRKRKNLWESQKTCEQSRIEWLEKEAMERAKAMGDEDWEKELKSMKRIAEDRARNRKLTTTFKGKRTTLNLVQIPTHDWFYSRAKKEVYHYDDGNFEAHPYANDGRYYPHHTLKVPPKDAIQILITQDPDGYFKITRVLDWYYSESQQRLYNKTYNESKPSAPWDVQTYHRSDEGDFYAASDSAISPDAVAAIVETNDTGNKELVDVLGMPEAMWDDITSQVQIEESILARNKRHLQQRAREGGQANGPIIRELESDYGLSEAADRLLDGTYTTEHPVTESMAAWIESMKKKDRERSRPPVLGCMTAAQFKASFKAANERTSSSPAGLHYTIWKAMALSSYCCDFQSMMISLPFMYGFANNRWLREIDVMLEKKKGIRMIHILRIIGLLEADFNTALKFFFAHEMQNAAEENGLSDEQWGSRKHRTSIDTALIKLLSFECARSSRSTIGEISHDCKACFDRMQPGQSNLYARKHNVDKNILRARAICVERMRRHVKTGLGVSDETYGQEPGEPYIGGEIQGKGDVPSLFAVQSSILLEAHRRIAPGLHLPSCTEERAIDHNNAAFVDDTDGHASAARNSETPIRDVVQKLQRSGQIWSELMDITGGSIALHKTFWRILAWEVANGDLQIVRATTERIIMEDGRGAFAVIDFQAPDVPNEGLGFRICPDGNQKHLYKKIRNDLKATCGAVTSSFMSEKETRQALYQRIVPKISYPMHLSSLTEADCDELNKLIRRAILPGTRYNRKMPSAVVFGPIRYGGIGLTETYTLQDQLQVPYFLKTLRWDKTPANDFLTTLDNVQLDSGFVSPIMENTTHKIEYIDQGLLVSARNRWQEFGGSMWIEKAWQPQLQRVGDESIMERFLEIPGLSTLQLSRINKVRLWLRVITIADLAHPNGRYIPDGNLTGEWQAGSNILWPEIPCPPKSWWALFRRSLRDTFCQFVPDANQPVHFSMELDRPLGTWYPVKRNTWWPCSRAEGALYFQDEESGIISVFDHTQVGFYRFSGQADAVPLAAHPITCEKYGQDYWTRRPLVLAEAPWTKETHRTLPPGHTVHDDLTDRTATEYKVASDGSVYHEEQVAAAAWLIASGTDCYKACFLMSDVNRVTSYRAELEGVFRALKTMEYLNLHPHSIVQFCDNELAVNNSTDEPSRPSDMIASDADLVLAIHALKSKLSFEVDCRHVYGHQDDKKKKDKQATESQAPFGEIPYSPSDSSVSDAEQSVIDLFSDLPSYTTKSATKELPSTLPAYMTEWAAKKEGQPTKKKELKDDALMNIECDRIASTITADALKGITQPPEPDLRLPYEGSRAMFRIGRRWIASRFKAEIYEARRSKSMRDYCKGRYDWDDETFELVDWDMIERVRKKLPHTQQMQTCKIMHNWLPVMHKRQFITGVNQCPGCTCRDETIRHMFQCPNSNAKLARKKALERMMKKGLKKKVPRDIMEAICRIIRNECDGKSDFHSDSHTPAVTAAIDQQLEIGIPLLLRGFFAKGWFQAIIDSGVSHPHRRMTAIQSMIWDTFASAVWKERNNQLYRRQNAFNAAEDDRLAERIIWYAEHRHELLSHYDQFLAQHDLTSISSMGRRTRREWVKVLDKARGAFDIEKKQRRRGQLVITSFFGLSDPASEAVT